MHFQRCILIHVRLVVCTFHECLIAAVRPWSVDLPKVQSVDINMNAIYSELSIDMIPEKLLVEKQPKIQSKITMQK
jgi:hypothetical protein